MLQIRFETYVHHVTFFGASVNLLRSYDRFMYSIMRIDFNLDSLSSAYAFTANELSKAVDNRQVGLRG